MKYIIDKNNSAFKLMYYKVSMVGLDVTPKNASSEITIKAKKILLVDKTLRESYIRQRINKKLDKVIEFMLRILNDEDTTEGDVGMVLDEINKLKGIIINKYREHMIESEYKSFLTKLIIVEEEFKKNYNQKIYTSYLTNSIYEEQISEGRSR
ncbi:MAG: hypothetical protein GX758_04915 [Tenericutes bacterium]|nr:hypothetical protein [Mycoplasmatota bacterium]